MPRTHPGRFIVIEGPEGAGKSTQAERLCKALQERGYEVLLTREPGGTTSGEAVRAILLDRRNGAMIPLTELLLVCAARAQHVHEVIRPALERGMVVVSDRFTPSTVVYQGHGGRVPMSIVHQTDAAARDGLLPDLTIMLDVAPDVGPCRGLAVQPSLWEQADRMESKELDFHRRVREGYLAYALTAPEKCVVISSEAPEADVAAQVLATALECIESTER